MFQITNKNKIYNFEYNNIKIIQCNNPTKIYRHLFDEASITIDNKLIKTESVIYIDNLTKLNQFIELNKKSFVFESIIKTLTEYNIINIDHINNIVQKINQDLNYELLDMNEGDNFKIVSQFFEVINNKYLDYQEFELILDKCYHEPKLFILNEIDWININKLMKYINNYRFIILTNDFRKFLNKWEQIELVAIFNDKKDEIIEINDQLILKEYIENTLNSNFSEQEILEIDSDLSWSILKIISNL